MPKLNELAVITENTMRAIHETETVNELLNELGDVDNLVSKLMGRIKIGSGGMRAFNVFNPGESDSEVVKTIEGVIVLSHKCNAFWSRPLEEAGDDKAPDCWSGDGKMGTNRDTGEITSCQGSCRHNKFGSDPRGGKGKACRNMRRLYILRENDLFPMILTLPPTALAAFDDYRVSVSLHGKKMHGIVTKISLTTKKNGAGVDYSVPVFEAAGMLPVADTERMWAYAQDIGKAAARAGIGVEDYAPEASGGFRQVDEAPDGWDAPPQGDTAAPQTSLPVDFDELPL